MRNEFTRVGRTVFAAATVAVVVIGFTATPQPAEARGGSTVCPLIYAPVICDNGKTYSNQCFADKVHAKGCVPTGAI